MPVAPAKPVSRSASSDERSPFLPFTQLQRSAEIAYYYGFMPIKTPPISKDDISKAKHVLEYEHHDKNYGSTECPLRISAEEKIALLRYTEEKRLLNPSQPALLYSEGAPLRDGERATHNSLRRINLDIVGTAKSIAEAELIKTSIEILKDEGFEDLYVDLNSIGDKDSAAYFVRELNQYYRSHMQDLAHCRAQMKKDLFAPLECDNKKCREVTESAPKSIATLTELSRLHFKEVLEYLESMNIPYKIDNHVLGNRRICSHTIFLIKTLNASGSAEAPEETLALGYRYNGLAKKLDMKREIPAIGVTLLFKRSASKQKKCRMPKKPKVYFIQLGFEAKLKSLQVIEVLRHAKIPLYQALAKDKLTSQIQTAENLKIPYVLIMGQKEALEGSVIVRDMMTRFQEIVPIVGLADYLKKLK